MALLFMDSYDHYATADIGLKYASVANGPTITAGAGRRSTAGIRFTNLNQLVTLGGISGGGTTALIVGFAVKCSSLPNGYALATIRLGGSAQLGWSFNSSGFLVLFLGGGSGAPAAPFATATIGAVAANTYNYVEVKAVIHGSAGSVVARVNGAEVLNLTGIDTNNVAGVGWDGVQFGHGASSGAFNADYDDLVVLDGTGAAPLNDLLGDIRVDARIPTAEGASSDWTPSSGTDNALMVDETTPDGDTTYNETSTVGAIDTHVTQDAPVTDSVIYGVQVLVNFKKTDAGACTLAPVVRHSGANNVGTDVAASTTYAYLRQLYGLNPGTGAAWDVTGFNAAEFGYKRTA